MYRNRQMLRIRYFLPTTNQFHAFIPSCCVNLVYILETLFIFRPAPKVHVQKLLLLPCVIGQLIVYRKTHENQSVNTVF